MLGYACWIDAFKPPCTYVGYPELVPPHGGVWGSPFIASAVTSANQRLDDGLCAWSLLFEGAEAGVKI
jgi:hypothetical protein